ncbi:thioredoxin-disulfide reductase [Denitrobaculum tricleocarpae]|uniref:Thioredoxin reductase n=1 Tax=Denitrobaculum tricleocarpae TaxID=2591009 RepID=A0A545U285_9PROT|nr:thioredoxin-disulfide reductase [Denitrobaculum tricleocarpae]TQV83587.1 thioredoxin-disulfide reductase [Denitrobaculum tricleocarpae]
MPNTHETKVLIIGSGAAGLTAAIYAARANLSPTLVAGLQPGGQLTITTDVENYPGFADVIQGPWLMEQMQKQAEHVGTKVISDLITEVDFSARPFVCKGDSGESYVADAVIISTGAQARWLGLPSEQHFNGRGVSACATCDGFFYRNKPVVVVGGGNSAVEESLYLAGICSKVTLVHRRDSLRAEQIAQERLFKHPKIDVVWNAVVDEILGGDGPMDGVDAVRLRSTIDGETSELPTEGVFVAIGHDPATAVFSGQLDMDDEGYILAAPNSTETSVPGVFAAGDCVDKIYRQAVTAAGLGCMAALQTEKFLAENEAGQSEAAE